MDCKDDELKDGRERKEEEAGGFMPARPPERRQFETEIRKEKVFFYSIFLLLFLPFSGNPLDFGLLKDVAKISSVRLRFCCFLLGADSICKILLCC